MAFTPLIKRPWGLKQRTVGWKVTTALVWLGIMIVFGTTEGFFGMWFLDAGEELGTLLGRVVGGLTAFFLFFGWSVIFSRPAKIV